MLLAYAVIQNCPSQLSKSDVLLEFSNMVLFKLEMTSLQEHLQKNLTDDGVNIMTTSTPGEIIQSQQIHHLRLSTSCLNFQTWCYFYNLFLKLTGYSYLVLSVYSFCVYCV
jgi:hypothetical protein